MKLAHAYGEDDNEIKFLPWLIKELKIKNNIIKINNPYEYRDFIHVDDAAYCFIKIIDNISVFKKKFYRINVDTKKYYSLKQFINQIIRYLKNSKVNYNSKIIFAKQPAKKKSRKIIYNKDDIILKKIGWNKKLNLQKGIIKTLDNSKW